MEKLMTKKVLPAKDEKIAEEIKRAKMFINKHREKEDERIRQIFSGLKFEKEMSIEQKSKLISDALKLPKQSSKHQKGLLRRVPGQTPKIFNFQFVAPYNELVKDNDGKQIIHSPSFVPSVVELGNPTNYCSQISNIHPEKGEISLGIILGDTSQSKNPPADFLLPFFSYRKVQSGFEHFIYLPPISKPYKLSVTANFIIPEGLADMDDSGFAGWKGLIGNVNLYLNNLTSEVSTKRFMEGYTNNSSREDRIEFFNSNVSITQSTMVPVGKEFVGIGLSADLMALTIADSSSEVNGQAYADYRSDEEYTQYLIPTWNPRGAIKVKSIDMEISWEDEA